MPGCGIAQNIGQAHLFDAMTGGLLQSFDDPTRTESDELGLSVAIDGNHIRIGGSGEVTSAASELVFSFWCLLGTVEPITRPAPQAMNFGPIYS